MEVVLIIGVVFIATRAYKGIVDKIKTENNEYTVVVQNCKAIDMFDMPLGEKLYEVTVKLEEQNGFSDKTFKSEKPYNKGDVIKVSMNIRTNIIVPMDSMLKWTPKVKCICREINSKRKKKIKYCSTVQGELANYKVYQGEDGDEYCPVYKFYHNGNFVMIDGEKTLYCNEKIGKKVTIVINEVTGDIYRLKEGTGKFLGYEKDNATT